MEEETATKLLEVNHTFYQSLGKHFFATRSRLQPGVKKVAKKLLSVSEILDLGCGNGELAYYLVNAGYAGSYIGLDISREMLAEARQKTAASQNIFFYEVDISKSNWPATAVLQNENIKAAQFDAILAFAVLYNIIAVALCLAGWMNPLLAAVLMPLSAIVSLAMAAYGMRRRIR